jgi:hypothetical protein
MGFSSEWVLVEFSNKGTLLEQYFRRFDCCLSCVSFFMFHTTWWEFSHCSVNHMGSWQSDAICILSHLLSVSYPTCYLFWLSCFLWRKWDTKGGMGIPSSLLLHSDLVSKIIRLFYDVSCCYDPHAIHVVQCILIILLLGSRVINWILYESNRCSVFHEVGWDELLVTWGHFKSLMRMLVVAYLPILIVLSFF